MVIEASEGGQNAVVSIQDRVGADVVIEHSVVRGCTGASAVVLVTGKNGFPLGSLVVNNVLSGWNNNTGTSGDLLRGVEF